MKWGVRKTYYKSLDRKQKKKVRKDYYKTPEGRLRKSVMIGTLIAGPLGGFIGSSIANKKINSVPKTDIDKAKKSSAKYQKMKIETDEEKVTRLIKEEKVNPKTHHIFDQNGNLMMVYWDD